MGYMIGQFLIWISMYIVVVRGAQGTAPRNVRVLSQSPHTVTIEWDEPETTDGEIEGYKIFYTTEPELPVVLWQVETVSNSRMATVIGLDPYKTYTFSVLAYSKAGQGPLSQAVQVITRQGVPLQPWNLKAVAVSPNEVDISWGTPDDVENITSYTLYYNDTLQHENRQVTIYPPNTSYMLSELTPDTIYHIQLAGRSARGEGVKTTLVQVKTPEFIPGEPKKVHVYPVNSSTIHVKWQPPKTGSRNGIIRGYYVYYVEFNDNDEPKQNTWKMEDTNDGYKNEMVITGLKPGTRYSVSVAGYTRKGDGLRSRPKIVTTKRADGLAPRLKSSIIPERIAFVNDSLELLCKFRKPRPYVIWRYNGELIKSSKRVHIGRNALEIRRVRLADAGTYNCVATNEYGSTWGNFTLMVLENPEAYDYQAGEKDWTKTGACDSDPLKGKPMWTKQKDDTKSLAKPARHNIEIDCDTRGHPRPNITWYKNNKEIQIGEGGKYTKDGWKIKISELTLLDQANYTCVVQNECGTIRWTYGLEVVQRRMVAPMIGDIANQTVMKGEDAVFTCKILISDSQPFLQWLRHYKVNGSYVDENGEPYVHKLQQHGQLKTIDDPQYLKITNVTEEDMGWYTCLVANSIGMNYRSAWLTVLVDDVEYEATIHFGSDIYAGEYGGTLTLTLMDADCHHLVVLSISEGLMPNAKITKEIKAVYIPQIISLDLQITGYMMPAVQIKSIHLTINKNNDGKEYIFTDIGWVNPNKKVIPDPGCQANSTVMDVLIPNTRYLTYDKMRSEDVRCRDGYRQKASEVTCLKTGEWSDQLCAMPRPELIRGIVITSSSTYSTWAAQRAVDGNSNRAPYWCHCCASTTRQYEPWYKVDLGRLYKVQSLIVLGRGGYGDIGGGRGQTFKNMRISYGKDAYNEEELVSNYGDLYVYNATFAEPKQARYLQLTLVGQKPQYFVICELLVYGF